MIFGVPCNAEHAKKLRRQYVRSQDFSETDFTMAEETHLDRLAVPSICTAVSHPHSAQYCEEPCLNSSTCEEDLHVLVPVTTYSTKSITSLSEEPIQSDTSLPSFISPDQSLPAETNTFSKEDTFFPLGFANESASGGELRSVNLQSTSPKREAQHSLIIELGLYRVAKPTPCKKKLYDSIQTRESVLCKLRKKYVTKNLKEVC